MTEHSPAPDDASPKPALTRSRHGKVVAGVCDGAGRHFGIDPVVFRVVLAVLALTGGTGLIAYGLAWLLLRQDGEEESEAQRLLAGRVEGTALTAVLVALVGCGLFLSMLGESAYQAFSLVLLAALAGAVLHARQRRRDGGANAVTTAAPPAPGSPSWWREPLTKEPLPPGGRLRGPSGNLPDGPPDGAVPGGPGASRPRDGSLLGVVLFPLALLAAGVGVVASWRAQPLGTSLEIGLTAALAVFGLGFVVSAWTGRARGGTVIAAVLTTVLLVGAAALPKTIGTEWSRTQWSPRTVAQLRAEYELGSGQAELDLTALDPGGGTVATRVSVGAGRLVVRIPDDATVRLTADVGFGDLRLPGDSGQDVDVRQKTRRTAVLEPHGASSGTVVLDLEVGFGQVEVVR